MVDELPPPEGQPAAFPPPAGEPAPAKSSGALWGGGRSLPSGKVLAGVGAAAVVLVGGIAVVASGGGGGGGDCTKDLLAHFRRGGELGNVVVATDLDVARDHGYDDGGSLEDLGASRRTTGTYPGLLANRFRFAQLYSVDDVEARTGVDPTSIRCSMGNLAFEVSAGSFDPPEVTGSAAGDDGALAASDDRLAIAGGPVDRPARLLEPLDGDSLATDDNVVAAVDRLIDAGAYSYVIELPERDGEGEPADAAPRVAGIGIAEAEDEGEDADRALWVVWVYGSDDAATAGRPAMARHLADVYEGIATVDADGLTADGNVVSGSFPIREPEQWLDPIPLSRSLLPSE